MGWQFGGFQAAATLIITLTTCFVGLFGLTQAGEAVQKATWKTLDLSLSLLCALLLYFVVSGWAPAT